MQAIKSCGYCHAVDHESHDHRPGIDKRQQNTIGTVHHERIPSDPIPPPQPEEIALYSASFYAADQTRRHRLDPFIKTRRICYECGRELLPDEQLEPLRASWDHREVILFFCDECATFGPLAPVSECYEALSTADADRRRETREDLLTAAREQRQKAIAQLRAIQARDLRDRIQAAFAKLTPLEETLCGLELWIRNISDLGILTTVPDSKLFTKAADKRIEQEREVKAKAKALKERLKREGSDHARIDAVLSLCVEFDQFQPKMQYPGSDAMGKAVTGHEMDEKLSMVANRIDGTLPARGAFLASPDPDPEDLKYGDSGQMAERKTRHGYVADAPTERKERERTIVADFMTTAHKAEFDDVEQNLILTWLGGAKQPELAKLSGRSQPTISRLLRRVLERAIALQSPLVEVRP
jgi:hypothetical protein